MTESEAETLVKADWRDSGKMVDSDGPHFGKTGGKRHGRFGVTTCGKLPFVYAVPLAAKRQCTKPLRGSGVCGEVGRLR